MAPSKRQAYTFFSALFLVGLTCIGAYALYKIRNHHLPIPVSLGAFTLALPAIAGLALEALTGTANHSNSRSPVKWSPKLGSTASLSQYAVTLLFVFETVLATLAGTYLSPVDGLTCGLNQRWLALYRQKNAHVIRRIQEAFQCCGLHSTRDMAYPFPSKDRDAAACTKLYDRQNSCFDSWRDEERVLAGLLLLVTVATALWKILVIYMHSRRASWSEEARQGADGGRERRALEYADAETPYRDQPEVQDGENRDEMPSSGRVIPSVLRDDD